MEPYWSEANGHGPHSVKYESEAAVSSFPYCTESSLNFSTSATAYSEDDAEYATGRRNKTSRQDPLSHRIIEKRRRDRMNSCLADLSRLIPPQYQRKGRGRIEKTEIIEMAIRHLKHLQSECNQKENEYRMGYNDCMKEAAKFLYDSQMQEFCYRLLARLQEHCEELMKSDCYKARGIHSLDNVSASSGSPHQAYHAAAPLCQLRDMLGTTSDIEHSNDHNDVKDLSFRNHLNQLQRNNASASASVSASSSGDAHHIVSLGGKLAAANAAASSSTASSTATTTATAPKNVASSSATCAIGSSGGPNNSNNIGDGDASNQNGIANGSSAVAVGALQPHQAAVITSTAPSSLHGHNTDSSNHDFESSREPHLHADTSNMHSPPPRDSLLHPHHSLHLHLHPAHSNSHSNSHHGLSQHAHPLAAHQHHHQHTSDSGSHSLLSVRMRNFSESSLSHDIEHNNNSYKYKNHIKERFNHELHDEETSSEHCHAPPPLISEHSHTHSLSEHSRDGTEPEEIAPIMAKKRKLAAAEAASAAAAKTNSSDAALVNGDCISSGPASDDGDTQLHTLPLTSRPPSMHPLANAHHHNSLLARDEKPFAFGDIKTELSAANLRHLSGAGHAAATARTTFSVPVFALHGQGTYYVPLNVDYNALVPFLNGADLLEKNYGSMPAVHPININVNFMPPTSSTSLLVAAAAAVAAGKQQMPAKLEAAITNGWQ